MIRSSDTIDALCAAFVAAQAEFPAVPKETRGQVGNAVRMYADLATVIETLQPVLAKHGLGYVQFPATSGPGHVAVTTRLLHTSGQWMEDELAMPAGNGAQGVGSAITYSRRYALLAVLGVATEDDDGAAASTAPKGRQKPAQAPTQPPPATTPPGDGAAPTENQRKKMHACFNEAGIAERADRLAYAAAIVGREIGSSNELNRTETGNVIDALERLIVETRRGGAA
jgi:hypothetical protein